MVKIIHPSLFGCNLVWKKVVNQLKQNTLLAAAFLLALGVCPQKGWSAPGPASDLSVTLTWDPSPSPDTVGYRVYYGTVSRDYSHSVTTDSTSATITGLIAGTTYYFAVTSFNAEGIESVFSEEISYTPGGGSTQPVLISITSPTQLQVQGASGQICQIEASEDLVNWAAIGSVTVGSTGVTVFTDTNAVNAPQRFYRTREAQL